MVKLIILIILSSLLSCIVYGRTSSISPYMRKNAHVYCYPGRCVIGRGVCSANPKTSRTTDYKPVPRTQIQPSFRDNNVQNESTYIDNNNYPMNRMIGRCAKEKHRQDNRVRQREPKRYTNRVVYDNDNDRSYISTDSTGRYYNNLYNRDPNSVAKLKRVYKPSRKYSPIKKPSGK